MKFSIITAVYNNKKYIGDAINSVLSQKEVDLEYLIMDGQSLDGTLEIIQKLNSSNIKLYIGKDDGIYDALNKGFSKASGDVLGIMHSDDLFASDEILKKVEVLFNQGADVVYADLDYVNREDITKVFRHWESCKFKYSNLRFGWIPPHPSFYFKTQVLRENGFFDLRYKISADYDFMLRVLKNRQYKIAYLPETAVKMRVGGESNKSIANIIKGSIEDHSIAMKYFRFPLLTVVSKVVRKIPQLIKRRS